jgi:cyanophycinase
MARLYAELMPLRAFYRIVCLLFMCFALAFGTMTCAALGNAPQAKHYKYFRIGFQTDAVTKTQSGFALMGGGTDLDEAFRWMCQRAGGGDFLVLRATGDDDYNPYIQPLCKLNSVATLILPDREAANDPFVAETIAHAEAIFIAGGDQANYIRYWKNTPVQTGMNAAIKRGVPIGGTSAGLAVMGEWAYSAEGDKPDDPNLDAKTALMNPLGPRVTLVRGFLDIPILKGIITDSHFAKRDRMGRLLVFIAKIKCNGLDSSIRGIGIDEKSALLLEPDGHGKVVGAEGRGAYMVFLQGSPTGLDPGQPLTSSVFQVQKIEPDKLANISTWIGNTKPYSLLVRRGSVQRPDSGDSLY